MAEKELDTIGTSLPLTRFTQEKDGPEIVEAARWIRCYFLPFMGDLARVRKHIIKLYASAANAMRMVKCGDGEYKEIPDWKTRMEVAQKMEEWYEKTVNQIYRAAKDENSPIGVKEFAALGPRGMVEDTYRRIREAGAKEVSGTSGESVAS